MTPLGRLLKCRLVMTIVFFDSSCQDPSGADKKSRLIDDGVAPFA
jgi:hypothetical protein